jgi:hypothetical protein
LGFRVRSRCIERFVWRDMGSGAWVQCVGFRVEDLSVWVSGFRALPIGFRGLTIVRLGVRVQGATHRVSEFRELPIG